MSEEILSELSRTLDHRPSDPIHIVISDDIDGAQGLAEVLPLNVITLFAGVPHPFSELGDFDDFLRLLLIHEMVHVVHLDTIGGIPWAFNLIFGKQWSPNLIQPRWFVEGLAVYLESKLTGAGRVRSHLIEMIVRTQVMADTFPRIDQVSNVMRRFFAGSFPWILGGRFIDFIARRHGDDVLRQISHHYGGRPLPYGINLVTKKATGETMVQLWEAWREEEEARAKVLLERVQREGVLEGALIERPSPSVVHPRFSRQGQLAFVEEPRDGDRELVFLTKAGEEELRLRTSAGRGAFTPDGRRFVATVSDNYRSVFRFDDLEIIDLDTGDRRRLTEGERTSDPSVSPDGRWIVAVKQAAGCTWLVKLPIDGGSPQALGKLAAGYQVSAPRWSPDGRAIAASLLEPGGARHIALFDPQTGAHRKITRTFGHHIDPAWSADGRYVYFASDLGGVFNIYRVHANGGPMERMSNVRTGAMEPAVSADRRLYIQASATGWTLRSLDPKAVTREPLSALARPIKTSTQSMDVHADEPYSPWETLLPRAYVPSLGEDGVGTTLGVAISGADVTRNHNYTFQVSYGVASRRLGYSLGYTNQSFFTPISLSSSLVTTTRPGRFAPLTPTQDRLETIFRAGVSVTVPMNVWDFSHAVSFAYNVDVRRGPTLISDDPFQPLPGLRDLTLSTFSVSWRFSQVRTFAESISPASGHALDITLRLNDPLLGSDLRVLEISGHWTGYFTMPWLQHHVVAARISLGASTGDSRGRGVFVLGGLPIRDVFSDLLGNIRVGADVIRGYPVALFRGRAMYLANVEYRLPIWQISWAVDTIPFFFDRLYGAVFADAGATPSGRIDLSDTKVGLGAELRLDLALGYFIGSTARIGIARGLMEGASNNFYVALGGVY